MVRETMALRATLEPRFRSDITTPKPNEIQTALSGINDRRET